MRINHMKKLIIRAILAVALIYAFCFMTWCLKEAEAAKVVTMVYPEQVAEVQEVPPVPVEITRYNTSHMTENSRISKNVSRGSTRVRDIRNMNLKTPSLLTVSELNDLLKGTGLEGLGESYIRAEENYHVNAMFLVALSINESGYGSSWMARNRNNIFGWGAGDDNPKAAGRFSTKSECINTVAKGIAENYIDENGKYYRGGTLMSVGKIYASDPEWANKVSSIMLELDKEIYTGVQ